MSVNVISLLLAVALLFITPGARIREDITVIGGADGPTEIIISDKPIAKNPEASYALAMPLAEAEAIQAQIDTANDEAALVDKYGSVLVLYSFEDESELALFDTDYGRCMMYRDADYAIYELGGRVFVSSGNVVNVSNEPFFAEDAAGVTPETLVNAYDESEYCLAARYEGDLIYLLTAFTDKDGGARQQEYVLDPDLKLLNARLYAQDKSGDYVFEGQLFFEYGVEIELPDFIFDYIY